jgi:hypothetical protein
MKDYTEQDLSEMSEQIKKNIAEGKRLCGEIEQKLDEREAVVAALRAVGIEVNSRPTRLVDRLKGFLHRRRK